MASKLYHSNILQKELEWLEKEIAKEEAVEEKVEAQQKSGYHVDPETGKIVYVKPQHKAIKKITLPKRRVVKRIRIKKKRKLK
jgi:hypothetical protein|tara:strand:- start:149 stop:397 length:249 start_codon:yes stop_codon:yes gene_type:complete